MAKRGQKRAWTFSSSSNASDADDELGKLEQEVLVQQELLDAWAPTSCSTIAAAPRSCLHQSPAANSPAVARQLVRAASVATVADSVASSRRDAFKVTTSSESESGLPGEGEEGVDGLVAQEEWPDLALRATIIVRPRSSEVSPARRADNCSRSPPPRSSPRDSDGGGNLSSDEDCRPRRPALGEHALKINGPHLVPGIGWWANSVWEAHLEFRTTLPSEQPAQTPNIEILCAGTCGELLVYTAALVLLSVLFRTGVRW